MTVLLLLCVIPGLIMIVKMSVIISTTVVTIIKEREIVLGFFKHLKRKIWK